MKNQTITLLSILILLTSCAPSYRQIVTGPMDSGKVLEYSIANSGIISGPVSLSGYVFELGELNVESWSGTRYLKATPLSIGLDTVANLSAEQTGRFLVFSGVSGYRDVALNMEEFLTLRSAVESYIEGNANIAFSNRDQTILFRTERKTQVPFDKAVLLFKNPQGYSRYYITDANQLLNLILLAEATK